MLLANLLLWAGESGTPNDGMDMNININMTYNN